MIRGRLHIAFMTIVCMVCVSQAYADYLVVSRDAAIKIGPSASSAILEDAKPKLELPLASENQSNGYYCITTPEGQTGWIYRTFVRRYRGTSQTAVAEPSSEGVSAAPSASTNKSLDSTPFARRNATTLPSASFTTSDDDAAPQPISICSFNIQFLGLSRVRQDKQLAHMLGHFDLVVVQELVAPPYPGTFPDGSLFKPVPRAAAFFDAMHDEGFDYVLSPEDTGPGARNHLNSSATEWWVAFYKSDRIEPAVELPHGFLSPLLSGNPDYDRVPFAFPWRRVGGGSDFVLISVHLHPNSGPSNVARRKEELAAIGRWVDYASRQGEKDYIVLGDMNIESDVELHASEPPGFQSLNDACVPTNTNPNKPKPYDQVLYRSAFTTGTELPQPQHLEVLDLPIEMKAGWTGDGRYPGDPYKHDAFRAAYSDHDPVFFKMTLLAHDDD